jgi:Txe/YoeB family toxin of toxin-antitoxin system
VYKIRWTKQAQKDAVPIERAGLKKEVAKIMGTVERDPYEQSQRFEKLVGNMKDKCSRRINYHHRFVYEVLPNTENLKDANGELYEGIVKVISMWGHY